MRLFRPFPALVLLFTALTVSALEPPPQSAPVLISLPPALLPQSFAGWNLVPVKDAPRSPAAGEASVLQEYGMAQHGSAIYRKSGSDLLVSAWRFNDATGAFGAFTFFRQPGTHAEKIGHEAAVSGAHFLFWNGTSVIDATFMQPVPDEKSVITALATQIPVAAGAAGIPPSLPHYLPAALLDPASVKYAIGPAAYAQMGGNLPASAIDFAQDTEVVIAQYGPPGAQATLTLLLYPTPQIAGAHLKTIGALAKSAGFTAKRSGPLVAIAGGNAQTAQHILSAVTFNDYVTINHPEGYVSETVKLYRLLMGITMLVVILVCASLILGFFFGGGRALIRVLRGKPVSAVAEEEFISLHLGGERVLLQVQVTEERSPGR